MKSKTSLRETFGIHEPGMYEKKYQGTDQMSFEQFKLIPKRQKIITIYVQYRITF